MRPFRSLILNALLLLSVLGPVRAEIAAPAASESIVFIGNGLGERMIDHPYLEARLLHRFSQQHLVLRNLCRPGDTAGFRPHPSRKTQWAFPGAEKFHPQHGVHAGEGTYPTPDEWLTTLKADTVMAFFGYNESFDGKAGLERFKGELTALIAHTAAQSYNGKGAPRLILVSPIAYEDLTKSRSLPNGKLENVNLQLYTQAMAEVAAANKTLFVDLYTRPWPSIRVLPSPSPEMDSCRQTRATRRFLRF